MKKRDLLVAGLLLMGLSAYAQEPTRPDLSDPRSAKVVFVQDFEKSWEDFLTTKIDSITELTYYENTETADGNSFAPWDPANQSKWQLGPVRKDSIIYIYNGEMTVIDSGEKAKGQEEWGDDNPTAATIVTDNTAARHDEFSAFGEADKGGERYFQFTSDTVKKLPSNTNAYSSSTKLAARYRRNLFVRLNPGDIEEKSSYRLTFYVKAKKVTNHEETGAVPTVYADVMRGYYHIEKPFSMGYIDNNKDSHPYEYSNTFEYTKNDFNDDGNWDNWEKVTFMTYYTTDSIAEYFVFKDGWWWANDSAWQWNAGSKYIDKAGVEQTTAHKYRFIQQPKKYFVRLGFPADYTVYSVDNISLTKSWIGGCEYFGDKMRVNFGYKTNLKDLVAAEKKAHGYDQIELDKETFDVWCHNPLTGTWFKMPMRSAEYHADGYMYLFTKFFEDPVTGDEMPYQFADYDSVYVTFRNPSDAAIQLKYTDAPFPMGHDSTWIKNGKVVPDFVNELAIPNPTAKIWKGVYSKYDLPPVMLQAPYEEGSFALTPVDELKFKFSRKIDIDNKQASSKAIAYVGDERWGLSWSASDSMLVLTRDFEFNDGPNKSKPLAGDYEIEIINIAGIGTDPGDDVVFHYHFGAFDRDAAAASIKSSDWRSEIKETGAWDRPMPASLWCYNVNDGFYGGEGLNYSPYKKCGLYKMVDDGKNGNALFYLSGRDNGKYGSLYTVQNFKKGSYSIAFSSFGWARQNDIKVYVYAKPEGNMAYASLKAAKKTQIGTYKPGFQTSWDGNDTEKEWDAKVERFSFSFSIPEDGDYVIEWETPKEGSQAYYGVAIGNFSIASGASALAAYNLNAAVTIAQARIAKAEENLDLFAGDALTALNLKTTEYVTGGTFDKTHSENQAPSIWAEAVKDLEKYTDWMAKRMDTINAFVTKLEDANKKVEGLTDDYKKFDVTAKLEVVIDSATKKFDVKVNIGKDIEALTTLLDNAMKAVDDRKSKNDNLNTVIANADKEITAKERTDYEEYGILADTLAEAKAFDAITAADADVDKMSSKLSQALLMYTAKVSGWKGQTQRLKAFRALADELEITEVTGNWAIKNFVDTTQVDNDEIADIYKAAVKYAIYQMIAENELDQELDLTPFIKNYNLYATPRIVERTNLNANSGDAHKADSTGAQIQHVKHQWNSGNLGGKQPIWVMIQTVEFTDLYPGWTVKAGTDGNQMVTPDDASYSKLQNGIPCFDAQIAMDWNGKAEMSEVLTNLPAGYYSIGVGFKQQTGSNTQISAITKDSTYVSAKAASGAKSLSVDSVKHNVATDSTTIKFVLTSGNGWSEADDFTLTFLGKDESFNYAGAVAAAKADLDAKIANRATFVNAPAAAGARVEYYTVGGMKVNAPKAGEIIIRKTTKNGKVVVDKVLVK